MAGGKDPYQCDFCKAVFSGLLVASWWLLVGQVSGGCWVFSLHFLSLLPWGMSASSGEGTGEGQMVTGRTTGRWKAECRALKVSVSPGEAGREAELHIHLSTQQAFPGAFQGTVYPRAGPVALPEPPSSPKDMVMSLPRLPIPRR